MNTKQGSGGTAFSTEHVPVLLQEVLENLQIIEGGVYFDGTFGGGGYSKAIATAKPNVLVIATDLDSGAIERGKKKIENLSVMVEQSNFAEISQVARKYNINQFDGVVADLGFSSDQIGESGKGRGFSFKNEKDSLIMTLADNPGPDAVTAREILNNWEEESIADILYGFGGEHYARRIARVVIQTRAQREILTVGDLLKIVEDATPKQYQNSKTHPATKTFQALRIAVNAEYQNLEKFLETSLALVAPGGRIVIVSFHGGENKIVKKRFSSWEREGLGKRITKKVIKPSREEILKNPRARSALMRVFEKK